MTAAAGRAPTRLPVKRYSVVHDVGSIQIGKRTQWEGVLVLARLIMHPQAMRGLRRDPWRSSKGTCERVHTREVRTRNGPNGRASMRARCPREKGARYVRRCATRRSSDATKQPRGHAACLVSAVHTDLHRCVPGGHADAATAASWGRSEARGRGAPPQEH